MNPEIKARWVAALQSGEYSQTSDALRIENSFCCLGVLCDLYVKDGLGKWEDRIEDGETVFATVGESGVLLPEEVGRWAGLPTTRPITPLPGPQDACIYLADLNDRGSLFPEIASLIEQYL